MNRSDPGCKMQVDAIEVDGRRLRGESTRRKIVEALLDLVREGDSAPSADVVAARAGVARRTVFRLFKDMDSLYREMSAIMLRRVAPIVEQPLAGSNWRSRLDQLLERRALVFEELLPLQAASEAHRIQSAFLQSEHRTLVKTQREILVSVLPAQIVNQPILVDALDLVMSLESWRRLRHHQRLTRKESQLVVACVVRALVDD